MFNNDEFFAAFAQHGLLVSVVYDPLDGSEAVIFQAGFKQPAELLLTDGVASDEYQLELHAASSPALGEGAEVSINGDIYKLRSNPRRRGDGAFSVVGLTKVLP